MVTSLNPLKKKQVNKPNMVENLNNLSDANSNSIQTLDSNVESNLDSKPKTETDLSNSVSIKDDNNESKPELINTDTNKSSSIISNDVKLIPKTKEGDSLPNSQESTTFLNDLDKTVTELRDFCNPIEFSEEETIIPHENNDESGHVLEIVIIAGVVVTIVVLVRRWNKKNKNKN